MERRASHLAILVILIASASLLGASRLVTLFTSRVSLSPSQPTHSYRGRDFPASWPIPALADAKLFHEDSVHYALGTELGVAEWKANLPSGGALLYLGPDSHPFTLSMFHQLRCLDILREILVEFYFDQSPNATYEQPKLAQHCMNYLRQTVLCRGDLRLENVRAPSGAQMTVTSVTHSCKDWTAVYDAAEQNHGEYLDKSHRNDAV